MKNWIRVILVFLVLVGGAALFGYNSFTKINEELDKLSASYISIASTPSISFSNKKNKEEAATTTPSSTATSTPQNDFDLSFLLPEEDNELYIGCTYEISLQASTTIESLETTLIETETGEASGPIASGLESGYEIDEDSQSFEWEVGGVWPGEYIISVSKINGTEQEVESEPFIIHKMTDGISEKEKENICK